MPGKPRFIQREHPAAGDLLHAYRAGTRIAWTAVLQEINRGALPERAMIGQLAGSLMTYLDCVSTAVEEAYLREWHNLMFRRAHERWELATELLTDPDPGRAHVLAEAAGILLPDAVQIVALPAGRQAPPDADEGIAGFLVELQGRSVFFLDPAGVNASLPTVARRAGGPLGVSDARPWLDGLGPAVSSACRVADLAVKMKLTGPVHAEDLMVEQILAADPTTSRRLFNSMLSQMIERDPSGDLLRTLEAYLETGCRMAEVARKLHIHPNTVAYRLDRIRDVGGIDLDSADDRFGAHLAIRARRFYQLDDPD